MRDLFSVVLMYLGMFFIFVVAAMFLLFIILPFVLVIGTGIVALLTG